MEIDTNAYIASLPKTEQRRIYETLLYEFRHDNTSAASSARDFSRQETDFYDALIRALRDCGSLHSPPIDKAAGAPKIGRKTFSNQAMALHDYITNGCNAGIPPVRRALIMTHLFTCYVRFMAANFMRRPASAMGAIELLVPGNFARLPQAVENSYPGYVRAHILHLCVPVAKKGMLV